MKMTIGELIMVYRKRKDLSQMALGQIVFKEIKSPNVKIKKIELGQQSPTEKELVDIAHALGVTIDDLRGHSFEKTELEGFFIHKNIVKMYSEKMDYYMKMLSEASKIPDKALCDMILSNIAEYIADDDNHAEDGGECVGEDCHPEAI